MAAFYYPQHCAVNPQKYHSGLLRAVLKRGVPVISDCAVKGITAGFTVQTVKGTTQADKVLLATNGYTRAPFAWFARRVFPLPSYLIATEPLSPDQIADVAPGGRMMVETRARHSYFRVSPDGTRLLYGGRASMVPMDLTLAARRLHATMAQVWPQLTNTKVSHVWAGNTGYTFSHMPHVGQHAGLHYAMGFSGSGTVMAPWLGAKAAYQALGDPRGHTWYSHAGLRSSWLHPFETPYFLHAANLWYRAWVDGAENRAARR